ncbi:hypothetical protein D9M73_279980 [compost metagenome]
MQQRAGARHPQVRSEALARLFQLLQSLLQLTAPDVTTVDHADRQHLIGWQAIEHHTQLLGRAHQVHMQAIDGQANRQSKVVFKAAEVRGDEFFQR